MAVKSYALTTRARLIEYLGLDASSLTSAQENVLDRIIDAVTEYIEKYIGFRVKQTEYTTEEYDTDDSGSLILNRYPISTSANFTIQRRDAALNEDDWETIDSKYYHINHDTGIVHGASGWKFRKGRSAYRITYTAGYNFDNSATFLSDTEAGDLEYAAWSIASTLYNKRKDGFGVAEERIGDYMVKYAKSNQLLTEEVTSILDHYAGPSLAGPQTPYVY